jgi:hypothetical protein
LTSGLLRLSVIAEMLTSVNNRRMRMSATEATWFKGRSTTMPIIMAPLNNNEATGVCFLGCNLPKVAGRLPSLPMAKETLEAENTWS